MQNEICRRIFRDKNPALVFWSCNVRCMHRKFLYVALLAILESLGDTKDEHKVKISIIPLRRLKVAILKFSLMYLINNVHAATSGIQLPIPLKPAASSNLFIHRLEEAAGFRGSGSSISLSFQKSTDFHNSSLKKRQGKWQLQNRHF